jgi:hypothetical protein
MHRFSRIALRGVAAAALTMPILAGSVHASSGTAPVTASGSHASINCSHSINCAEVQDPEEVFGEGNYVGHDEPSVLFYSNQAGAGNDMTWHLTLPSDPPASDPLAAGKSFNFQLHPAFWFGMAMCDTQSYPEQVSTCPADSDSNIVDPAVSPNHPGTAFMELQFYPPGWVTWPAGDSCDGTRWCAALNIDSLSEDPVNGTTLNATCTNQIGGSIEYVNFAFLTRNGVSQAPASPVNATLATFTPDATRDLFMSSGDQLIVSLHDSGHGLVTTVMDKTTHQSGSMTASAANGFGMVKYAPTGTECTNIPYDFHPMYSTSSEQTRVIWAAHSYNIAFSDETGHFEACNGSHRISPGASCPNANTEYDGEGADSNDTYCFPASSSSLIAIPGCLEPDGNTGFDSNPYHAVWPDGNTSLHPTSIEFSSPLIGGTTNYQRMAFEADLPRIEFNTCNRSTGAGCTLIPTTDDGMPADFYPFFSTGTVNGQCTWLLGNDIPGLTANDFSKNNEYGPLVLLTYLAFGGGGATTQRYNDFRQVLSSNPCPAG